MANISICASVGANTGAVDCDVTRGNPIQLILGSAEFAPSDYADNATFEAAFLAAIKQATGVSDKLFPFPVIQGTNDTTVAAKFGTLGYGLNVKLLRSKQGYEFDVLAGSDLEKRMIKFDGKILPAFIFDDQNNIWGIVDSGQNFKGAKYLIGVEPRAFGDANNPKTTKVSISIVDSRDFVENAKFASVSFNSTDLVGLLDAQLYETTTHTTNVWKIGVRIVTNQIGKSINVNGYYATELAVGALWKATVVATGVALVITSVANDATNGGWTITFDSTQFTALSSGAKIRLELVDPAALDAADVENIESGFIILTK